MSPFDPATRPVGMLSKTDLLWHRYEDLEEGMIGPSGFVREGMTRQVFTLRDTALAKEAAALMALQLIHHVPVVDERGLVVGMVTSLDVMGCLARESGFAVPGTIGGSR